MKFADVAAVWIVCSLVAGCEKQVDKQAASRKLDAELVSTLNNIQVENAIIAQHTLYPYHFALNSETLNELGERDLAVLARYFQRGFPDPSECGKSAMPECGDSRGEASGMRLDAFGRLAFRAFSPAGKDADTFFGIPFVRAG